jgi:hypothetical protein
LIIYENLDVTKSSIKLPVGHPLSGSWLESVLWPVSIELPENRASCDALHKEGCNCSGVGRMLGVVIANS